MIWHLLAPGPSACIKTADMLRGFYVGVVSNAFELAPWADFLAASDRAWWQKHPQAKEFEGKRFSCHQYHGVERVQIPTINSGVLAMECAKREGATRIYLHGYDMHGTHFFGPYKNGLSNTPPDKRQRHLKQFKKWATSNRKIEVINCTQGSALTCFKVEDAEDVFRKASKSEPIRVRGVHRPTEKERSEALP